MCISKCPLVFCTSHNQVCLRGAAASPCFMQLLQSDKHHRRPECLSAGVKNSLHPTGTVKFIDSDSEVRAVVAHPAQLGRNDKK